MVTLKLSIFSFNLYNKILRLICLHCQANSGFKQPLMETYKREIIRVKECF
jgi:hypothetical protein